MKNIQGVVSWKTYGLGYWFNVVVLDLYL